MPGLRFLGGRHRTIIHWDYLFHKLVKKGVICPFFKYKSTKMKGGVQIKMCIKSTHCVYKKCTK